MVSMPPDNAHVQLHACLPCLQTLPLGIQCNAFGNLLVHSSSCVRDSEA